MFAKVDSGRGRHPVLRRKTALLPSQQLSDEKSKDVWKFIEARRAGRAQHGQRAH